MSQNEAWLSGPIPEIPFLLQPAAHALVQAELELKECMENFPDKLLWKTVAGRASVGFHLQHLFGVMDRLTTYARELPLSDNQFGYLKKENTPDFNLTSKELVSRFSEKLSETLNLFSQTTDEELRAFRTVGRKKLPTTVMGLYFHIAEHSQRHFGQLLVTVSVLKERELMNDKT
ncbi:DinB family protein [uncultured Cyclobacterium sp.]|uniref:DinB family protein n=1 Tax=uncultured Cyclobacterium sp. TaxID=453820 RepID=UPI0030EB73AE|tara:strand:- start:18009 stop:18533 length:525 start_codon:yes stop_codon:yes gene_type:complete